MAHVVERQRQKQLNKKRILQMASRERDLAAMMDLALVAARSGDSQGLDALIEGGFPPNTLDKYGGTVLHWAAGTGQLSSCKVLHARGADPYIRLTKGGGRGRTVLHYAARNGHLQVCQWLVDSLGMLPDIPTHDGTTPFQLAIWKGHLDVCDWLVHEKGVDVHQVNGYGCNGSHWAALGGNVDSARWLQAQGVSQTAPNLAGHTAVHKAAQCGHAALCEWLLGRVEGARQCLEMPDEDGNRPSQLAAAHGAADLSCFLTAQEGAAALQLSDKEAAEASGAKSETGGGTRATVTWPRRVFWLLIAVCLAAAVRGLRRRAAVAPRLRALFEWIKLTWEGRRRALAA